MTAQRTWRDTDMYQPLYLKHTLQRKTLGYSKFRRAWVHTQTAGPTNVLTLSAKQMQESYSVFRSEKTRTKVLPHTSFRDFVGEVGGAAYS